MWPFDSTQEGDDAYRYQLAYMAYTLALTQYHRTPAYRELWRDAMRAIIQQMLRIDVWGYWELVSRGSHVTDPALAELSDGWNDPAAHMNVMYSGHLLLMVGLYEMLYRDRRYDEEGSITFKHRPPFHGLGPTDFGYDHSRLLAAIRAEFERNGYLGCECEPNGIFVRSNLPAMLGFLVYDYDHGTDIARPTFARFRQAWSEHTGLFSDGESSSIPDHWQVRQEAAVTEAIEGGGTTPSVLWWAPLLRVFDQAYAEQLYASARDRVVVRYDDGSIGMDLDPALQAHNDYRRAPARGMVDPKVVANHSLGMAAFAASEFGDEETLAGLLKYADTRLESAREDGAFWYRRNDDLASPAYCSCLTGNALLAAARLNVTDGFSRLFNEPWPVEAPERELEVVDVDFPSVLVTGAFADEPQTRLQVSTAPGGDAPLSSSIGILGVDEAGRWSLEVDRKPAATLAGDAYSASDDVGVEWRRTEGKLSLSLDFSRPRVITLQRTGEAE
jgi:hypothetical protein